MEVLDGQLVGPSISPWSQVRVEPYTSTTLPGPSRAANVAREGEGARPRDIRSPTEEGDRTHLGRRVFQPAFCSPEERRWLAPSYKPQEVECVSRYQALQDGRDLYPKRCATEVRLDGEIGSLGCLPNGTYPPQRQEVPEILLERQVLPIQKPSFRACHSAPNLHEAYEAYGYPDAKQRCETNSLFGRYLDIGSVHPTSESTREDGRSDVGVLGLQAKFEEVRMGTFPMHRISWFSGEFNRHDNLTAINQAAEGTERMQSSFEEDIGNPETTSTAHRSNDSLYPSCCSSSSALSGPPETTQQSLVEQEIRRRGSNGRSLPTGSTLVDTPVTVTQRQTIDDPSGIPDHHFGCIKHRLGSHVPELSYGRSLEQRGKESAHQLVRAKGCLPSPKNLCLKPARYSCIAPDRQRYGNFLHQPQRRHSFEEIVRPSTDDLGLVPSEEYHHLRRAHSWSGQCRSRPGIEETNWTRGMDAQQRDFQKDPQEVGPSGGGPLRSQAQSPTPEILQLQTRPWSGSDRCLSSVVEGSKTLRFPTIQSSRKMSEKDKAGASPVGSSDCSSVAGSIMVSHHVGELGRSTSSFASLPPCIGESSGADTSTSEEQQSQISRLESVRKSVEDRGISKEAFEILSSSWRSSTEKSYSSAWRKWMGWCHERKLDPFPTSITTVVEFLAYQFQQGFQYSTINTYRSALSATIAPIEGQQVGQHPLVCKLLQGMFNLRPPMPRYQSTWDVGIVVQHLKGLSPTEEQTLQVLSKKLVTLLALANASRASDIHALDLQYHKFSEEGVLFHIPSLTKTRRSGPPKTVFIAKFEDDSSICPVRTLQVYIEKTKHLRKSGKNGGLPLFISVRKPHEAVSSATISRWVKQVLTESGIPTDIFKAHSVRAASSTAAKTKGVAVTDIMQTAGWSRSSTFEKFYYKPIEQTTYSRTVLQDQQ